MNNQPPLSEAVTRFKQAAEDIQNAYETHKTSTGIPVTPGQLIDGIEQFLSVVTRADKMEGETGPLTHEDVDQLGDYGLNLLTDLGEWAKRLDCRNAYEELQKVSLAATDWIIRHDGRIRTMEPVVNAFSDIANTLHDPRELEKMASFMSQVLKHCPVLVKDTETTDAERPWRLLHINRGIVATRTHNPVLMQVVFDELVRAVPDEAPDFFREGMQQMDALGYPDEVREVMSRYYADWTRPTMH